MKTTKTIKVSTGEIYVAQGEKGLLEFLTVGDCGNAILSGKLPTSEYEIIENND